MERLEIHTGKTLKSEQIYQLYPRLKEIGDDAWNHIVDTFLVELKMMPSQMPTVGQFLKAWYKYKRTYAAYQHEPPDDCPFCMGAGTTNIIDRHPDDNSIYTQNLAFCDRCNNWRRFFSPAAIRGISDQGVIIDTANLEHPGIKAWIPFVTPRKGGAKAPGTMKQRAIQDLIDGIGGQV